jgi:hypothetical protein
MGGNLTFIIIKSKDVTKCYTIHTRLKRTLNKTDINLSVPKNANICLHQGVCSVLCSTIQQFNYG